MQRGSHLALVRWSLLLLPTPHDPKRPITDISSAWHKLRTAAGVACRLHDLRHTAATKMAEAGVPESTMLALMGHTSRAMLERYLHIRMAAKRQAVESVTLVVEPAALTREGNFQDGGCYNFHYSCKTAANPVVATS